ncbi:MAG: spore germination protein [Ruminococcus sp.]|nr:spore germination protein [Ruminococcus sp.]
MQLSYNNFEDEKIEYKTKKNILNLRTILGNTMDLNVMNITINSVECSVVTIEAMVSTSSMSELIFRPLMELERTDRNTPQKIMSFLTNESLLAAERIIVHTYGEASKLLFSGFALIFVDEINYCAAYGIQGYDKKSISEPTIENNIMGSQEAFAEVIRTNISLVRRRIKHPSLRFEMTQAGKLSNTDVCLVYIQGKVDEIMLSHIRKRISEIKLDSVLGTSFIEQFLEPEQKKNIFSQTGYTERPDMLCSSILQGRISILIDGTPFAVICPYLFSQNFNTFDEYEAKTYFASFLKLIRYLAFFFATAFPGIYLAAVNFSPEMLNLRLLSNLSAGEKTTILPLFTELVIIMLLLEIMREASIRLPHSVSTAMSIAGGLIIGDAAVKSGIISSPLLIIVGISATASFVLPSLNQQISILRLAFIFAGGFAGFLGISVCAVMVLCNICSQSFEEIPITSPVSPFKKKQIADVTGRKSYKEMEKEQTVIEDFK